MAILEGPQRITRRGPSGMSGTVSPRWRPFVAPAAAAALGFAISVAGIGTPSVWYDEAATISSATRTWPELWAMLGNVDAVHALYYFLMHVVFDVFGYSPVTLRMPSAIAVGLAAGLVVILVRQLGRPRIALVAGLVFCLLPRVTWSGTEGRSYALTALFAVLLTVVFVRAQRSGRRWWVLYGILALVSVVLFIYLALVILAHGVTVLVRAIRFSSLSSAVPWVLAAGAAALVAAPFAQAVIAQSGQVAWIDPLGPATLLQVFRAQWFYGSLSFAVVAWALIVLGFARRRRDFSFSSLLLPLVVVPTAALLVASVVLDPIYQPRYLTMGTPFVAVAMAAGIEAAAARWQRLLVVVVIGVLAVPQIVQQRHPEAKENSSWAQVAQLIASERATDDVPTAIVYGNVQKHPSATARVMEYSYPQAFAGTIDLTLETPAAETAQLWETHAPIALSLSGLDRADVTYLITSVARDLRPETTSALASAGWRITQQWAFTSVTVVKYERD